MSGNTFLNAFTHDDEDRWMTWGGPYPQLLREKRDRESDRPESDGPPPLLVRSRPHMNPRSAWVEPLPDLTVTISDTPSRKTASSTLGGFGKLPYEVHTMILRNLDIRTLRRLASLSSDLKTIVDSLREYRLLVEHAGAFLGTLGHMRLAHFFTLEQLYELLTSSVCVACGLTGAFVFMMTCERACFGCLDNDVRFWVMDPFEARRRYALKAGELKQLRSLYTVKQPGRKPALRRHKVICQRSAAALSLQCRGEAEFRRITHQDGNPDPRDVVWDRENLPPLTLPGIEDVDRWGMQFMEMSFVRLDGAEDRVERIAWCEGCSTTFCVNYFVQGMGHVHGRKWRGPYTGKPRCGTRIPMPDDMQAQAFRERTMTELAAHLEQCRGVPLVYKLLAQED